jgi:hypothetical protein
MGGRAESIDPEPPTRWELRTAQGPIADDSCAQERRRFLVAEGSRDRVGKSLVNDYVLGVTSVEIPASEQGGDTEVLAPGRAESAGPTGSSEPGNAYPITGVEAGATGTDLVDDADHLVARYDETTFGGEVTFGKVQVCAADAADPDVDADLAGSGAGNGSLDPPERSAADRSRIVHCPCVHRF